MFGKDTASTLDQTEVAISNVVPVDRGFSSQERKLQGV